MFTSVLLVDDSKVSRMITKKIISGVQPDISIFEAENGQAALGVLAAHKIEAAIVDFHMPGMNGLELIGKIKELNIDIALTLLTANIQHEIQERAKNLGVGFMGKPAKADDVEAFLK